MTNQEMLNILDNLCHEAGDSVHASLGLIALQRDTAGGVSLKATSNKADRLVRSIGDVRDLLALDAQPVRAPEKFDAAHCLANVVELLNLVSPDRATRILFEAPSEPVTIRQDEQTVEHSLTRILDAALKLGTAGEVRTALNRLPHGDKVRFAITPPNPSVAVHLAEFLNADLQQIGLQEAASTTDALAVMVAGKRLRSLGATVELVRSGEAITLAIDLPSQLDGTRSAKAAEPEPLNILITEDCDDSYALTRLLLQKENVFRARDGLEAIDLVKKRRFDGVLMDIHMPGMDGYEAIRAIRDWETQTASARTPIVVLSSDDIETQRKFAAQSGCSGFLRKPLRNSDLMGLLHGLSAVRASVA